MVTFMRSEFLEQIVDKVTSNVIAGMTRVYSTLERKISEVKETKEVKTEYKHFSRIEMEKRVLQINSMLQR